MSISRILVSSGTEFESTVGYSRAVRVGPLVAVSGTTARDASGDIAAQTREALRRIEAALVEAGVTLGDVVRTPPTSHDGATSRPCTPTCSARSARPPRWSRSPR